MFPRNFSITVNVSGLGRVHFVDAGGNISDRPVDLTEEQANVVMNCVREGYWVDVSDALVVSWDRRTGNDVVHRIVELNATQLEPIEYELVPYQQSELVFMIGSNHVTGVPFYVGDYMAEAPFVRTFAESRLVWFNSLKGTDVFVQRGFIADTLSQFHTMWNNNHDRDLHVVWAKIKG